GGTKLRRVITDIMIAGQITAGDGKGGMQLTGKFEIVATGWPVESKIAAVDDEIGTPGVDVFADPMKVLGQGRQAAGKVGVGNLDQAKFGHATFLPVRLYILTEVGTM